MKKITLLESLTKNIRLLFLPAAFFVFGSVQAQYCEPEITDCGLSDAIANVTFAGIDNDGTCTDGGYEDNTSMTGTVTSGLSYTISVTTEDGGNEAVGVWIDYNQNELFEASEFTYVGITPGGTVTANILIPVSALTGTTRMRVRSFYLLEEMDPETIYLDTEDGSCAEISTGYGETEDYSITVVAGADCAGTPVVSATTSTVTDACLGVPFTLDATVTPLALGLSYQWESSVNGGTDWTNLGASQTTSSYEVTQTQETMYRVTVTCATGGASATSTAVTVGQNTASECYCTNEFPFDCADGDVILNVSLGTINNDTDCANDTTGYSDYTSLEPTELTAGANTSMSVTVGAGWEFETVAVFIDYNQNGTFEEEEFTLLGTGSDSTITENIAVPADAANGNTRMRVVLVADSGITADFACGPDEDNFGEIEDYTVTITGGLAAPSFAAGKAAFYPNPTNGEVSIMLNVENVLHTVEVYNVTGQMILSKNFPSAANATYNLDMQQAASGVYLVKMHTANGVFTQRLIKN